MASVPAEADEAQVRPVKFPLGTRPHPHHFPRRNRLVTGLSLATVVVEAREKSGSLISARIAGEQGRTVCVMPGQAGLAYNRGGHRLIREGAVLIATENGYGKRTEVAEFGTQGRGGQGLIAIQTSERNGACIGALQVRDEDEIMLISHAGTLVRTPVAEVSTLGRNTQGVRLIRLDSGDTLSGLARIEAIEED